MKPTRSLPSSWFGGQPRERRMALASIAVLLLLLGAIVLYQQVQAPGERLPEVPIPVEEPPITAGGPPGVSSAGTADSPASETRQGAETHTPAPDSAPPVPEAPPERLSAPLAGRPEILKTYRSLDEAYGDFRFYTGIAFAADPGQSVLAAATGVVEAIEQDPAEGMTLVVSHSGEMTTRYAGLGKVLVAEGATVEAGSIIGQTGEPGLARTEMGPHLAFEVWLRNEPVDPTTYLSN